MSLHTEINFETEICEYLSQHGWVYSDGAAAGFVRGLCLFPADVLEWVQTVHKDAWDSLVKNHGSAAADTLLSRLRQCVDSIGTLHVLRHGFDVLGLRKELRMAQFKPANAMNPEITARYNRNRLRVVRQVRYSMHSEDCIDLVLFLNGIPVATAELKSDYTQSVEDAVDQYRQDRNPRPKGLSPEPLLCFPGGALVHFAVSNSEVRMTTRLDGNNSQFLPFNKGNNGARGNPDNPNGFMTAYLWEDVWQRDSWLEILGRYLVTERDEKKALKRTIFPRYHQLDATRKLQAKVLEEGTGGKFLIQHSAGSGKTNSIAWTAHFLADLHDANNQKVFNTVLVVSDRNVIDGQLQDAIFGFERTTGVVATIKGEGGSKSGELADALSGQKKIVVCTIQTFPFAIKAVRELAATFGKRFVVIADEAHSSQTGNAAARLKEVLTAEELQEFEDGGEASMDDVLAAHMSSRASDSGITYIAFTATPKAKTMELFGRRPDPSRPRGEGNLPEPFHVYSMRQAIEEGFILDVLQNYTSYSLAFKLANAGEEIAEHLVDRSAARKSLMNWVRLHPYNIAQKVQIVVEHYRKTVAPLLSGTAKAMVVVSSRKEAVRWQLAMEKYIRDQSYPLKTLVAFSGEVNDPESGPEAFRETTEALNPGLRGRDIREAFRGPEYQILLVANKFQTGFDQPLLCGMYVDKRLDGIQAVQTLSRLNRCYPGKDKTYVLDFINDPEQILKAFKTYYTTAQLSDVTDPNIILTLRSKLDGMGYYDAQEVDRVVAVDLNPKGRQSELDAAIKPVAQRLLTRYADALRNFRAAKKNNDKTAEAAARDIMDALLLFKTDAATYQRAYAFLSQVLDYGNTGFEKRSIFFRYLLPLLNFGREREAVDLSQVVLTHHSLKSRGERSLPLSDKDAPRLKPITEAGSGAVQEKQRAYLRDIIEQLNTIFGSETTENDQLSFMQAIRSKLLESDTLRIQAEANTKEQFAGSPDLVPELQNANIESLDAFTDLSTKLLNSSDAQKRFLALLLSTGKLWEMLRGADGNGVSAITA
ncbi:MAG: type I restriction endonuclease subunit R [Planctomyces sp.]